MIVKSFLGLGRAELLSASGQNNSKFWKFETNKQFFEKVRNSNQVKTTFKLCFSTMP
jgi:hypothetical protein